MTEQISKFKKGLERVNIEKRERKVSSHCFLVFGYPDETLALVVHILHQVLCMFKTYITYSLDYLPFTTILILFS
jgi:hypothetical protein